MKHLPIFTAALLLASAGTANAATVTEQLLHEYQTQGAESFSATAGQAGWNQTYIDSKTGEARSCASCHGQQLLQPGKHARTGKSIEPLAPSRNAERLTDRTKIEKWLKRNCKWVLSRECSAQEKGNYLSYIQSQ